MWTTQSTSKSESFNLVSFYSNFILIFTLQKNKRNKAFRSTSSTFSALHLINDPQSFAEELFKKLEHSKEKFEVRLLMMSLISRLIGLHRVGYFALSSLCSLLFFKHTDTVVPVQFLPIPSALLTAPSTGSYQSIDLSSSGKSRTCSS